MTTCKFEHTANCGPEIRFIDPPPLAPKYANNLPLRAISSGDSGNWRVQAYWCDRWRDVTVKASGDERETFLVDQDGETLLVRKIVSFDLIVPEGVRWVKFV